MHAGKGVSVSFSVSCAVLAQTLLVVGEQKATRSNGTTGRSSLAFVEDRRPAKFATGRPNGAKIGRARKHPTGRRLNQGVNHPESYQSERYAREGTHVGETTSRRSIIKREG